MNAKGLILVAVTAAQLSWAQNYVVQSGPMPYVPLVGGTSITTMFPSADDSSVTIPIGFSFPYYMTTYTQVLVNSNGFISFTTGVCSGGCNGAVAVPSTTRTPHLVIAPWWDDHEFNITAATNINYVSTPSQLDIEWRDINAYDFSGFMYTLTFKVTLFASGQIQVHYGPKSGSGGTAAGGFEDGTGAMGAAFFSPCSATASCTLVDFPSDTLYNIGQPMQPDLVVQAVNLNSVMAGGGMLTLSISPTFRNFGQNAATGFIWDAYLSTDRFYNAGVDLPILTSSTPLSCAGAATVSDTAMQTVMMPPNGNYYVIVRADSAGMVAEGALGETNNVGSTANYFVSGLDLVAVSVSGPAMSGPGNIITVNPNWFNQGTDAAGNVDYGIYLSTDNMYSANDYLLYSATVNVMGGQTVTAPINITVPGTVPGGDFHYILRVNIGMPPVMETMTNNQVASSGKVTMRQADLVIRAVDFIDVATGTPIRTALFGTSGRMRITAANEGGADARNFKVGVVISNDTNLSLLQDTIVIESNVMNVPQGTTQVLDVNFTIPEVNRAGLPFTTGNYFWFGLLDSSGQVTELNEFNNNMILMQPVLTQAPAADLTVTRFDAPAAVGVGELAPVYRVFKNIGNRDASDVKYRYYVSANPQVTVDDIPALIVSGGTSITQGNLAMMQGAIIAGTEMIEIPATLTPGTYYLGAVLDTDLRIVELDETNNGLGSSPVTVAPSALRITTPALPDAVIGRPYSFQLSSAGDLIGQPTVWAIDTAQGNLPMGLMMSMGGLITGTPVNETVVGVTFTVTNNGVTAVKRFALRVLPTTTQVEITTPSLPSVVNSPIIPYETFLGAAGGVKPYTWSLIAVPGELLPRNLTLTAEGRLWGNPQAGLMEKAYPLTIEVRDTLGTRSRRQFNLRVVAPGAIVFSNLALPDGLVGSAYLTDIAVRNFDGSPLAKPLVYRVVAGALPDGIAQATEQDVLLLQGTPTVAGLFAFTIEVEDNKGRVDSADFLMRVYPSGLKVGVNDLPSQFRPGDPVDFVFVVNGASGVTFDLFSGMLPPGANFNPDGHVTGTIDTTATEGTYNFVVEARDSAGATGLGAFSAYVKRDLPRQGCKCSAIDGGLLWVAMLVVMRRRRR